MNTNTDQPLQISKCLICNRKVRNRRGDKPSLFCSIRCRYKNIIIRRRKKNEIKIN